VPRPVGGSPARIPKSDAPLRSGDFVPALSKPLKPEEKKAWAQKAERAIDAQLEQAKGISQPDLLAVFAEEAGELLAIQRALAGHPRWDEADTKKSADKVQALLTRIVDARVDGLKSLAANPKGPDSIRDGESEAASLKLDLGRLTRYGFTPPQIDVNALDQSVKKAVVDATLGNRGWSPR
jgi:hypothetical protein